MASDKKKVAIVGSGVSGIGALWALKSTDHEVHLYEAESRLGGHTNTVTWEGKRGLKTPVDTGFIVMNSATYPNFINFLRHLGIEPKETEMTFGVSRDQGVFEWAGTSLSSVFAQRENLFKARMWLLIWEIIRFNVSCLDLLSEDESEHDSTKDTVEDSTGQSPRQSLSIGEYLDKQGYSQTFRDDYLIPMTAAVWSTSPDKCSLQFPAVTLIRFLWNHHLLNTLSPRPPWLTISGGTKQYIDVVMKEFPKEQVHLRSEVKSVSTMEDGRVVLSVGEEQHEYDHVILATHGDQAFEIIHPSATKQEIGIMSAFKTSRNVAILHSDLTFMPERRVAWSAWNYLTETPKDSSKTSNIDKVSLTYWMNLLQHIPEVQFGNVLVTLNPLSPPDPRLVQGIWEYAHPLYNSEAIRSQKLLANIQNTRGISYCGAWTKYGFHEDGFSSGISVAMNHLGAKLPFEFVDSTYSRGTKPDLSIKRLFVRMIVEFIGVFIAMLQYLFWRFQSIRSQVRSARKRVKLL